MSPNVDTSEPHLDEFDAFAEKYVAGLDAISMTRQEFFTEYSAAVRIAPDR